MTKSAGVLAYRFHDGVIEVFLVHPGGPFWKNKDEHAWSMPKGEFTDEDPLVAAKREFKEETGQRVDGDFVALEPVKTHGKIIHTFAVESDAPDPADIHSNTFTLEWPPKSGKTQDFPEVYRAAWIPLNQAGAKIHKNQRGAIEQLAVLLNNPITSPGAK